MNKQQLKEYNKTWYWKFTTRWAKGFAPENAICGNPVTFFGIVIGWKWKIAKPNYKWNPID